MSLPLATTRAGLCMGSISFELSPSVEGARMPTESPETVPAGSTSEGVI